MLYNFDSYRYVVAKALSKTNPAQLTESEFVYCTETLRRVQDVSIDTQDEVNPAVIPKTHVVLGLLCNYTDIVKHPADVSVFMLSDAINTLTLKLKNCGECKSLQDVFTGLNLNSLKFPIRVK